VGKLNNQPKQCKAMAPQEIIPGSSHVIAQEQRR
jgi:hypothetical protein